MDYPPIEEETDNYEGDLSVCCKAPMLEDNSECIKCHACGICGGTGELATMGSVYAGEPHQALIDDVPCDNCRSDEPNDFSGATPGDR